MEETSGKMVFIGGGTGFIGSALTKTLQNKGYNVRNISRTPGPMNNLWTELEEQGVPKNCIAVVSIPGHYIFDFRRRWTPEFKQIVRDSRINTTKSLVSAIDKATTKPKVFISISGTAYYKSCPTTECTEDSPGGDHDFLSRLTTDWEDAAQLPSTCTDVRKVIIRTGIVLGKDGGPLQNMYWPFYFGIGGPIGNGQQFFASAFGRALWHPAIIPMPKFVRNAILGEERAKILTEGPQVIPKRVLELGFRYKFEDIDSAVKQCVSRTD